MSMVASAFVDAFDFGSLPHVPYSTELACLSPKSTLETFAVEDNRAVRFLEAIGGLDVHSPRGHFYNDILVRRCVHLS